MKSFTFKTLLITGVIIAAIVCLLPTFFNSWPHKKINLGLDLQGGMHLLLEVQNIKAVEAEVERTIQEIKKELRKQEIKHRGISRLKDNSILVKLQNGENKSKFETVLSKDFENLTEALKKGATSQKELNDTPFNLEMRIPAERANDGRAFSRHGISDTHTV